jgi:dienelactone hydrolase
MPAMVSAQQPLRVQFAHGLEGSPQGNKARLLARHFEAVTPAMTTGDFEACVSVHQRSLEVFRPHVMVGSSFGGAVVMAMLERGLWRGPTLLLAQAAVRLLPQSRLPARVPVWLVHGTGDEVIDPRDSALLAASGDPGFTRLIEVDDDHMLRATVASGRLVELVRELAESVGGEAGESA